MSPDASAPEILVVCYGNLCRSPMAAALAAERLPRALVGSAGTHAVGGDPAMPNAIEAMQRLAQLDISDHVSRPLTVDLVRRSDHVLTMSVRQAQLAAALAPEATGRIRLLGAYTPEEGQQRSADPGAAPARAVEIADPIGGSVERFATCLERLREAVDAFADWLERGAHAEQGPPAVGSPRWPFRLGD